MREPVYILIPVHDRRHLTLSCLAALRVAGDLARYHVVVVDDGSTDGTADAIRREHPDVTILPGDGNLWWTGAMVRAMRHAHGRGAEAFVWLNDDVRPAPGTIEHLVRFVRENPRSIVGCQGIEPERGGGVAFGGKRRTWKGYRFIEAAPGEVRPCDLLNGHLVCMPRSVVDVVGYPDVRVTPHYGGDALFLARARNRSYRLFVDARTRVEGTYGESPLYPAKWLTAGGEPLRLLKLVFEPRSGLSWRLWLHLNWESYSVWGLVMFAKKYLEILGITVLRFLPLPLRERLDLAFA